MNAITSQEREVDQVQAGGGVVCREGPAGLLEIALVHRRRNGDWTLPKGKLEAGESLEEAALREVEEETGLRCATDRTLACTRYQDRRGRDKTVCYWSMRPLSGRFRPNPEVDHLRWLTAEEALELLSSERERELIREHYLGAD